MLPSFAAMLPVYPNVPKLPKYLSNVTLDVSTENYYWASRLIGTLGKVLYESSVHMKNGYNRADN